jgi:alkanesulfonate monooxygenase SsuD/methylene tetrahydromethanopterin reductase-like flavin-dependent oxidoreductase (luciferase family)
MPQGLPVIYQVGASSSGRDFAARHADVIFSPFGTDFDTALAFGGAQWASRMAGYRLPAASCRLAQPATT